MDALEHSAYVNLQGTGELHDIFHSDALSRIYWSGVVTH